MHYIKWDVKSASS